MSKKRELNEVISGIKYQLKAIIHKLNIQYQYIDIDDLFQEALLYLWQQNENGKLNNKNDSYILQGCYYYLKNYIRKYVQSNYKQIERDYHYNSLEKDQEVKENLKFQNRNPLNSTLDEYLYYNEFNKDLSIKEKALLSLRMRGLTTREIGRELGISHTMVIKIRKKMQRKYHSFNQ